MSLLPKRQKVLTDEREFPYMWLAEHAGYGGVKIQLDTSVPRLRVDTGADIPTSVPEWLSTTAAIAEASIEHRNAVSGVWAFTTRKNPNGENINWMLEGQWLSRTTHGIPTPPRNTVALMLASATVGVQVKGITAEDLPNDAKSAQTMLRHVANAQGAEVEQVLTLWLMPVRAEWRRGHFRVPEEFRDRRYSREQDSRCGPLPDETVAYVSIDTSKRIRALTYYDGPITVFPRVVEPLRTAALQLA